jgi:hypothetical protein
MRQVLVVAAVVAVGLPVSAPPAGAGAAKGPTLRSLRAQMTKLQRQVKRLKKQVTEARNIAVLGVAYGVCSTAVSADTFQDTYTGLNGYFAAHALPAYFGAQTPLNDYGACQALSIVRQHNQNPPTTSVMRALLDLFKGSSSGTAQQSFMDLPRQGGYLFGQLFVLAR